MLCRAFSVFKNSDCDASVKVPLALALVNELDPNKGKLKCLFRCTYVFTRRFESYTFTKKVQVAFWWEFHFKIVKSTVPFFCAQPVCLFHFVELQLCIILFLQVFNTSNYTEYEHSTLWQQGFGYTHAAVGSETEHEDMLSRSSVYVLHHLRFIIITLSTEPARWNSWRRKPPVAHIWIYKAMSLYVCVCVCVCVCECVCVCLFSHSCTPMPSHQVWKWRSSQSEDVCIAFLPFRTEEQLVQSVCEITVLAN